MLVSGTGTPETIEADFLQAVTLAPNQRDAALQWGHWLLSRHRWVEAIEQFKKWTKISPSDFEPVWGLAYIYCNTGRRSEGKRLLKEFAIHFPVQAQLNKNRIDELLKQCQ